MRAEGGKEKGIEGGREGEREGNLGNGVKYGQ